MSHDHFCPARSGSMFCMCELIDAVRIDEASNCVTHERDARNAERARWVKVCQDRMFDLYSCNKDDDCHILARGVELALNDGLYELRDVSRFDEQNTLEHTDIVLNTHRAGDCLGDVCTIHRRSDHNMRSFPQNWRGDRGIMERVCPHGIGHPDPDDITVMANEAEAVHGCDGCCSREA